MSKDTGDRKFTFGKEEKLCHQKSIDRLFDKAISFIAYPLRVVYNTEVNELGHTIPTKVLINVSKRKFKRANKRNRVKRLIREAYRLHKYDFLTALSGKEKRMDIAFLYLRDELPSFQEIEKSMLKALSVLTAKLEEHDEKTTD